MPGLRMHVIRLHDAWSLLAGSACPCHTPLQDQDRRRIIMSHLGHWLVLVTLWTLSLGMSIICRELFGITVDTAAGRCGWAQVRSGDMSKANRACFKVELNSCMLPALNFN